MSAPSTTNERRHGDPLLPLWRQRLSRIAALNVFPSMAIPAVVLALSFGLASTTPSSNDGAGSARPEELALPEPAEGGEERTENQTDAEPTTTTTTTTTDPGAVRAVVVAQLQQALVTAGFPDLIVVLEGEPVANAVVRVTGAVPDEAARRVALESVTEAATAAGLSRIVDNIVLGEQASAASLRVEVSRTRAVVSGIVASTGDVQPLLDGLGQVYRPEQIDVTGVQIDGKALDVSFVDVVGEVSDGVLADRLTAVLTAALSDLPSASVKVATVEPARVEVTLAEILATSPLQFESGSDRLTGSAEETLVAIGEALVAFPAAALDVGGHTDTQGDEFSNQELSRRRAEAVVARLRALGVSNELTATGYGELRPVITPEASDADRAVNRRIEFRLA